MVKYRRYYVARGIYFFTVVLQNRQPNYLTEYINELTGAMRYVRQMYPFKNHAMVVLPDHLHVMWEMPAGDDNYSQRWRFIKTQFARNLKKRGIDTKRIDLVKMFYGSDDFGNMLFVTNMIIENTWITFITILSNISL